MDVAVRIHFNDEGFLKRGRASLPQIRILIRFRDNAWAFRASTPDQSNQFHYFSIVGESVPLNRLGAGQQQSGDEIDPLPHDNFPCVFLSRRISLIWKYIAEMPAFKRRTYPGARVPCGSYNRAPRFAGGAKV